MFKKLFLALVVAGFCGVANAANAPEAAKPVAAPVATKADAKAPVAAKEAAKPADAKAPAAAPMAAKPAAK